MVVRVAAVVAVPVRMAHAAPNCARPTHAYRNTTADCTAVRIPTRRAIQAVRAIALVRSAAVLVGWVMSVGGSLCRVDESASPLLGGKFQRGDAGSATLRKEGGGFQIRKEGGGFQIRKEGGGFQIRKEGGEFHRPKL
jgi:hypothetical protein